MSFFSRLKTRCRRKAAERKTAHELSRLSNRDLKDLGIIRNDIEFIARKSAKVKYPMPK